MHRSSIDSTTVGGPSYIETPATLIKGRQESERYCEMIFEDKHTSTPFVAFSSAAESGARISRDEANFVDGSKTTKLFKTEHRYFGKKVNAGTELRAFQRLRIQLLYHD
jgi:hypothetical protein